MNDFEGASGHAGMPPFDPNMGMMGEHGIGMVGMGMPGDNELGMMEEAGDNPGMPGDANALMMGDASMDGMSEMQDAPPPPVYNIQPPMGISVTTPATHPHAYPPQQLFPKHHEPMLGQGTKGPDVLFRIQMGLQSGVRSETDWCLSTLLTFTAARNFELLKERVDIMLSVVDYIYENWDAVTRARSDLDDDYNTLLLRQKVLEALLIVRNVCMEHRMAAALAPATLKFVETGISNLPTSRSGLTVDPALENGSRSESKSESKPDSESKLESKQESKQESEDPEAGKTLSLYSELRLLILEICEHVCFLYPATQTTSESVLFRGLMEILAQEDDKSMLIAAMRSLTRLMITDTKESSPLLSSPKILQKIFWYLLIDDPELNASSLDLLTQHSAKLQRVEQLHFPGSDPVSAYIAQLVRMLTFNMDREPQDYLRLPRRTRKPAPLVPPEVPPALMAELLTMNEPERATMWIRSCYDTDPEGEVLQVSLWSNYQRLFEPHERDGTGRRLLKAIDFIRTCTTNVKGAQAKVITPPEGPKKFIIKGLVPRENALPLKELNGNANSINRGPIDTNMNSGGMIPAVVENQAPEEVPNRRGPPIYGNTAALVLINIAKLQGGKELLTPYIPEIINTIVVNPQLTETIDKLLTELK